MADRDIETVVDGMEARWWNCPNAICPHGAILHDRYDDEDPCPMCCVDGCGCGTAVPLPCGCDPATDYKCPEHRTEPA